MRTQRTPGLGTLFGLTVALACIGGLTVLPAQAESKGRRPAVEAAVAKHHKAKASRHAHRGESKHAERRHRARRAESSAHKHRGAKEIHRGAHRESAHKHRGHRAEKKRHASHDRHHTKHVVKHERKSIFHRAHAKKHYDKSDHKFRFGFHYDKHHGPGVKIVVGKSHDYDGHYRHRGHRGYHRPYYKHRRHRHVHTRHCGGYYKHVWVKPVYETHYDDCGRAYSVKVYDGYWKRVWVPYNCRYRC